MGYSIRAAANKACGIGAWRSLVSAPDWGSGGRRFKSSRPDCSSSRIVKPLILISNDDGISARGINTLAEHLADLGEMWVVAPNQERSASSHALTLDRPLRAVERQPNWWAIDGTPADCIYLATLHLLPQAPDLV